MVTSYKAGNEFPFNDILLHSTLLCTFSQAMKTHWLLIGQAMKTHLNESSFPPLFIKNAGNNRGISCLKYIALTF